MKKILASCMCLCLAFAATVARASDRSSRKTLEFIDNELDFALQQSMKMYDVMKTTYPDLLVNYARNGKFEPCGSGGWVAGFFPGSLWYLYENTGDLKVKAAAEDMTSRMENQQFNKSTHDIGFMMYCSYGHAYRLTGRTDYRQILVNSANSLCTRFNPTVGCIRSWNSKAPKFTVIIDNMMNLELLKAAEVFTGEKRFGEIADIHSHTTIKNHFREDNSSFHVVQYNENTGEIIAKHTAQGIADDSSWSRGQSWGLYGFTYMYRLTGKSEYLDQAEKIAKYLMNHPNMPKDKVPYCDYDCEPGDQTPRDASAAALMASAFIDLSTLVTDKKFSRKLVKYSHDILESLASPQYKAGLGENFNFILKHSSVSIASNNVDTPLVYADYYYIEALMRYKRLLQGRPVVDPIR